MQQNNQNRRFASRSCIRPCFKTWKDFTTSTIWHVVREYAEKVGASTRVRGDKNTKLWFRRPHE